MIDMTSGYGWYNGDDTDARKAAKTRLPRRSKRWRHIGGRRVRATKKLDQSKVEYMVVKEKRAPQTRSSPMP